MENTAENIMEKLAADVRNATGYDRASRALLLLDAVTRGIRLTPTERCLLMDEVKSALSKQVAEAIVIRGMKYGSTDAAFVCPGCGRELKPFVNYCTLCGQKILVVKEKN